MGFFGLTKKKSKKAAAAKADEKAQGAKAGNAAKQNKAEQTSLSQSNKKGNAGKQNESEQLSFSQNNNEAPEQHKPQQQQQQEDDQKPAAATANNDNAINNNNTQVIDLPAGNPAQYDPDVTRDLVKKFISDIWNRGELDFIPRVCSPKIRFNGVSGVEKLGHEGFARMVAMIHGAFSDYHCEIHSMVVEKNKAFCRLRFSGNFTGPILGYAPHGKAVSWMGASEFLCLNGLILKVWELGDMKALESQLADRGM
jgi:predicted ester cyclase